MNKPTVQDIFQHFYPAYLEKYSPSPEQAKVARNIMNCKTGAYGANVGYICILHTWGSEMNFHPHIHTILLGGGLTSKNEWKDNGTEFFLPIWAISRG